MCHRRKIRTCELKLKLSKVLSLHQHYRSYGTGFHGSNDPTNSVKALKSNPIRSTHHVITIHTDSTGFYSAQRLDLFAWCVRLSRL